MHSILYTCPFIPAEWIAAHGFRPRRVAPEESHAATGQNAPPEGACPYAHAFLTSAESTETAGVVFTTVCDQMRRASECLAKEMPLFLLNVPTAWRQTEAHRYYISEIERFGHFLERLGGQPPSAAELASVMEQFDTARGALRGARGSLGARRYSDLIAAAHEDGFLNIEKKVAHAIHQEEKELCNKSSANESLPAIALVGGPLMRDEYGLFDLIEQSGARVGLDATETGERTLPAPLNRGEFRQAPLAELADMYFGTIPDASRRPNTALYQWLRSEFKTRDLQGVIVLQRPWCDIWHAEATRIKEWNIGPTLILDVASGKDINTANRASTRVEAFVEMLR